MYAPGKPLVSALHMGYHVYMGNLGGGWVDVVHDALSILLCFNES